MKILVIEDEVLLADSLKALLQGKGFEVECVYNGEDGAAYAETGIYDLLILDVMMPKMNGYEVARKVRADRCGTPILMLTAKSELEDEIEGLNAGADYYITKPFGILELISRVKAVLRRSGGTSDIPGATSAVLRANGIELSPLGRTVTANGVPVTLTYKEFELLYYLYKNRGRALTREEIMNDVWSFDYEGESRTVDMHIKSLRQKLDNGNDVIVTVRGVGYKIP